MVEAVILPERVLIEVNDITFPPKGVLGMDSMLVFILHAETASAISLPTVDL